MRKRRESITSYLIVGPFAIVLAFPFYWMLMTALRSDNDLYDIEQVPFKFNADSPTSANFRFLFEQTDYGRWLANTALVGAVVVLITLVLALPAAYVVVRSATQRDAEPMAAVRACRRPACS